MPTLNINAHLLAFSDADAGTSQPRFRNIDWAPGRTQLPISTPLNREFDFAPGETRTIFDGTRALGVDGTTEFDLSLNPVRAGVYRLTASAGTAPAFRTSRALALTGVAVTATVNNNATMEFVAGAGTPFAAVVAGDQVWIPDLTTGDAAGSPFNVLNVGLWNVIAATGTKLTCTRPMGQAFQGATEVVTPAADSEFIAFSSGPVRPGDYMEISAGFSPMSRKTFQLVAVTDSWVEFVSGESLPLETGIIPGAAGLGIYNDAQEFIYIETDQEAVVRLNGSVDNRLRAVPQRVNDLNSRSMLMLTGPVWRLDVVNRNVTAPMTVLVIAARMQA